MQRLSLQETLQLWGIFILVIHNMRNDTLPHNRPLLLLTNQIITPHYLCLWTVTEKNRFFQTCTTGGLFNALLRPRFLTCRYFSLFSWYNIGFLFRAATNKLLWNKVLFSRGICSWIAVLFHSRPCENISGAYIRCIMSPFFSIKWVECGLSRLYIIPSASYTNILTSIYTIFFQLSIVLAKA